MLPRNCDSSTLESVISKGFAVSCCSLHMVICPLRTLQSSAQGLPGLKQLIWLSSPLNHLFREGFPCGQYPVKDHPSLHRLRVATFCEHMNTITQPFFVKLCNLLFKRCIPNNGWGLDILVHPPSTITLTVLISLRWQLTLSVM